jgi:(p)ppGpp synthase/HD superfamily hydrolase
MGYMRTDIGQLLLDKEAENRARLFAAAAHAAVGQVRKYTNDPYIVHPAHVARLVLSVPHTTEQVQAAFLHDVLEDTQVPETLLRAEFGGVVADLVVWLTEVKVSGNRAVRKRAEVLRLAGAPAAAQTIKLADLISNTSSIVKWDPEFAVTYLQEKRELLEVLTLGDPTLRQIALGLVTIPQLHNTFI